MRNLLTLMNDPDVQDYLGMLYHNRRQPKDLYQSLPSDDRYSTPVYKPSLNPNLVAFEHAMPYFYQLWVGLFDYK